MRVRWNAHGRAGVSSGARLVRLDDSGPTPELDVGRAPTQLPDLTSWRDSAAWSVRWNGASTPHIAASVPAPAVPHGTYIADAMGVPPTCPSRARLAYLRRAPAPPAPRVCATGQARPQGRCQTTSSRFISTGEFRATVHTCECAT